MASESTGLSKEVLEKLLGRELGLVEERGLEELISRINGRNLEYFYTVGVYNNNDTKSNHVAAKDLTNHIAYNLLYRPGRAFFVNFVCLNQGYLGALRADGWADKLKKAGMPVMRRATSPYQ